MHNLREYNGTFKGLIGESMFKLTDKYLTLNRFCNKQKYFNTFNKYLTKIQAEFINKHWFSIDAIKISFDKGKKIYLYEIKTKNKYQKPRSYWKIKFTQSTVNIYREALKLGFEVKIAIVWLLDDWNYEIQFQDFKTADYCIDKPKKYDLKSI